MQSHGVSKRVKFAIACYTYTQSHIDTYIQAWFIIILNSHSFLLLFCYYPKHSHVCCYYTACILFTIFLPLSLVFVPYFSSSVSLFPDNFLLFFFLNHSISIISYLFIFIYFDWQEKGIKKIHFFYHFPNLLKSLSRISVINVGCNYENLASFFFFFIFFKMRLCQNTQIRSSHQ